MNPKDTQPGEDEIGAPELRRFPPLGKANLPTTRLAVDVTLLPSTAHEGYGDAIDRVLNNLRQGIGMSNYRCVKDARPKITVVRLMTADGEHLVTHVTATVRVEPRRVPFPAVQIHRFDGLPPHRSPFAGDDPPNSHARRQHTLQRILDTGRLP